MPRPRNVAPRYRRHSQSGLAVADVYDAHGKRRCVTLGKFGSPESQVEFARLVAVVAANAGRLPDRTSARGSDATVAEAVEGYLAHAERHYRTPDGEPTSEIVCIRRAVAPLVRLFGPTLAREFDAGNLELVRDAMVAGSWMTEPEKADATRCGKRIGWSRGVVNSHVARIRALFRWACLKRLVPPTVIEGLQCLAPLRAGRSDARETAPVEAVDAETVERTLPFLPPHVRGLVRLLSLTGARVGELCSMREGNIDTSGEVWFFRPRRHKGSHRGHVRAIPLGPKAQLLLRPFLTGDPEAFVFSPRVQAEEIAQAKREARRTPVQPSQVCRKNPDATRVPSERFTPTGIGRAVRRACEKAGIAPWHAHRVRHSVAREMEREFGLEGARAMLGHRSASMTVHYSGLDERRAAEIAARVG